MMCITNAIKYMSLSSNNNRKGGGNNGYGQLTDFNVYKY